MSIDVYPGPRVYTVNGIGPYNIGHEYEAGAMAPEVLLNDVLTVLPPEDFTVEPDGGDDGEVFLTASAAATYDGGALTLRRSTPVEQGWAGQNAREKGLAKVLDRQSQAIQEVRNLLTTLQVGSVAGYAAQAALSAAEAALSATQAAAFDPTGFMRSDQNLGDLDDVAAAQVVLGLLAGAFADLADQATAEGGADNTDLMTSLRTRQLIEKKVPVLIRRVTINDQATIEFTEFDDQKYSDYPFVLRNVMPAVDGGELRARLSIDAGANFLAGANDYAENVSTPSSSSNVVINYNDGASRMMVSGAIGTNAGYPGCSGDLKLINPAAAISTKMLVDTLTRNSGNSIRKQTGGCYLKQASAVNAIQFYSNNGNTLSGEIEFYGVPK